ncbi:ExbD/TolR family protein [Algibacter sp.]|uniref:ExbD/TolR family protein n=1 Tax=Algibacter sp. TaxID=1872428 RepID=UPI003C792A86
MRNSKLVPEVNAGSMADIAFLLLIFFLVTATISSDEGINRLLPRDCPPGMDCTSDVNERNILRIVINNSDEVMMENDIIPLANLKDLTKSFLDNNGDESCNYCHGFQDAKSSDNPKKAIVSLQNGQQTSYKTYVAVQNEITKAYYELRQSYSLNVIGKASDRLTSTEEKQARDAYPFILSEAETK